MSNLKMSDQVLLKINSEIYNEKLIKGSGDFELTFFSGRATSEISIIPQINQGLIYIKYGNDECEDGKCELINPGKLETAVSVKGENIYYAGVAAGVYDRICHDEESFADLFNNIIEETDFSAQYRKAEKELFNVIGINKVKDNVALMLDEIIKCNGRIKVGELAELFDYSVRHFNRIFTDNMDISPKLYMRILRCSVAISRMTNDPNREINEYMENLGYFDQSHFQREFKWFTGITPKNFLKKTAMQE